jgi:DNA-binding transcriptional MerR regulator
MEGFRAKQTVALTGVPYRTLDYWARSGFLVPSIMDAAGIGTKRRYAFRDLIALRVAIELRRAGISQQSLRQVVRYIRHTHGIEQPLAATRLLVAGNDVVLARSEGDLLSVLRRPGQSVLQFVVDLGRLVQELQQEVEKSRAA